MRKAAGRTGAGTTRASALTALVVPVLLQDGARSDAKAEPAEHVEIIGVGLSGPGPALAAWFKLGVVGPLGEFLL